MQNRKAFLGAVALALAAAAALAACGGDGGTPMPTFGMALVAGGTFTMGSPANEAGRGSDEAQHSVAVSAFSIGKHTVTQGLYRAVMGTNPSGYAGSDNLPVGQVTWYDAVEFCNKLSQLERLDPAYTISDRTPTIGYPITSATVAWDKSRNGYRLPTEAEWEYAARGGSGWSTPYCVYAGGDAVGDVAWYKDNSGGTTHEVGGRAPNGLGLHDMSGSVWEWCWDWYGAYGGGQQADPEGVLSGTDRVFRGGCGANYAEYVRAACRSHAKPFASGPHIGFRIARP